MDKVTGTVKTIKSVEFPPFQTVHVQGLSKVKGHETGVNVVAEAPSKAYSKVVVTIPGYSCLHQYSSRVSIGLRNVTCKPVTI